MAYPAQPAIGMNAAGRSGVTSETGGSCGAPTHSSVLPFLGSRLCAPRPHWQVEPLSTTDVSE